MAGRNACPSHTISTRNEPRGGDAVIGLQMGHHAVEDRRSQRRTRQFGSARILIEFANPVSCALVDRSESGARLRVVSVLGIPDRFVLQIGSEQLPARVAWRSPAEIGVAFDGD